MNRKTKQYISLLLACLTLFALTSCQKAPAPLPSSPKTPAPTPDVTQESTPMPTPEKTSSPSELLAALDYRMFAQNISEDIISYNTSLAHPENFPDIQMPKATWGDISYESFRKEMKLIQEYQDTLALIPRETLSDAEKLTYDTLEQYCAMCIGEEDYYYYDEPLTPNNGLHTNLPMNMAFFEVNSKQLVEEYLALLSDMPRFINDLLEFEKEKAARGLFMTNGARDTVISQIEEFAGSGENCFLIGVFEEKIAGVEGLSEDEIAVYTQQNADAVAEVLLSYTALAEGLAELENKNNQNGLSDLPNGKEYFELGLKDATCSDMTPEEAILLMESISDMELQNISMAYQKDPTVFDQYGMLSINKGTLEDNINYLKELQAENYPELPEHEFITIDIPSELENQFAPAAYLIPPIDDAAKNMLIINEDQLDEDPELLFTLAHEAYAGHMFQYVYQRNLKDTGYMRNALSLTAYYEGWSTTAEQVFASSTTEFNSSYCVMMNSDKMFGNILLPAIISIYVNALDWKLPEVTEYLSIIFDPESASEFASIYYDEAVNNPFYYIEYASGYAQLQKLWLDTAESLGEEFVLKDFFTAYLDLGPSFFNLIEERIADWGDALTGQEALDPAA